MPISIDKLAELVEDHTGYFSSKHLGNSYAESVPFLNHLLPAVAAGIKEGVDEIKAYHAVDVDGRAKRKKFVHYTSIRTLVDILSAINRQADGTIVPMGNLRLYDSIHLNDPDEGRYLLRNIAFESKYSWMEEPLKGIFSEESKESNTDNAYICSFIAGNEVADNLVFWRTYGREGKGCSIECSVDPSKLSNVIYGKDNLANTIDVLRPILDCLEPIIRVADERVCFLLAARVWNSLKSISYLYKSSAYKYEQEARVVELRSEIDEKEIQLDFSESATGSPKVRHYIECAALHVDRILPSGAVVTIGPCVPFAENIRKSLEILAGRSGLGGRPEIRISGISYRSS